MSTRWLQPGDMVTDSAGRPNPLAMREAGIRGHSVYGGHGRYNTDLAYILQCWSAGIVVMCNHENVGTEARQGEVRGITDAREALDFFRGMGWNNDTPILFSGTDFDVQWNEFGVCDGYYRGIRNEFRPFDGMWGPYAKSGYIDHMASTGEFPEMYPWQAGGWRYGFDSPWAYLVQNYVVGKHDNGTDRWAYEIDTSSFGADVDLSRVRKAFPAWGPRKDVSVDYPLWVESSGAVVVSSKPGEWFHVTGGEFYGVLRKNLDDPDVIHVDDNTMNELRSVVIK